MESAYREHLKALCIQALLKSYPVNTCSITVQCQGMSPVRERAIVEGRLVFREKTRFAYRVGLYRSSPRSHVLCVVLDSKQVLCFFHSAASGMLGVRWVLCVSVFWLNTASSCSQHPLSSQLAVYHIPHILKTRPCIVNFCYLWVCH